MPVNKRAVHVAASAETAATPAEAGAAEGSRLRITLVKSGTGYKFDQKRTLIALGLHKLNGTIEQPNNASIRGMLIKVKHLVRVEEIG